MKGLSDRALERLRREAALPDLEGTRYRMVRGVGSGGMGEVFLVEDQELRRRVAMKVLSGAACSPEMSQRMLREARIVARLEHPGIVPVHDVGALPDGRPYFTMKFVQGERLDAWSCPERSLPDRLRLFHKVCEAVAFAHVHGVLHRDLKPENIMVGPFGEVLVMDWGIAKIRVGPVGQLTDPTDHDSPIQSNGDHPGNADAMMAHKVGQLTDPTEPDSPIQFNGDHDGNDDAMMVRRDGQLTVQPGADDHPGNGQLTVQPGADNHPGNRQSTIQPGTDNHPGNGQSTIQPGADNHPGNGQSITPPSPHDDRSPIPTPYIMGTPGYMSPEQSRGANAEVDERSDIHGLGGILYFLLTSRAPNAAAAAPAPPRAIDQSVPRPIEAICMKALAPSPEERYVSAAALAADILRNLDGAPVSAYRESPVERVMRWGRKNRFVLILIGAYLLMRVVVLLLAKR